MRRRVALSSALVLCALVAAACSGDKPSGDSAPPPSCTAGTLDCACAEGARCDGGLVCVEGSCRAAAAGAAAVSVASAAVRSCELLLEEKGARIASIAFAEGAMGAQVRRGDRIAVTFAMRSDVAPGADVVKLALLAQDGAAGGLPGLRNAQCYDRSGNPVASAGLELK